MLSARQSVAVPAWARKTGLACISCHVGGSSRLNGLGRDFQLRGHRLPGDMETARRPADLLNYATLATKFRHSARQGASNASQLQTGSLFAGGPLTAKSGFFAEYTWYDRRAVGGGGASELLDAYVQYVDRPSSERFAWVRAGRLYPFAAYALGGGGRIPLSRPRLLSDRPGGLAPPLLRRASGVSGGYSGTGRTLVEAGVRESEASSGRADPSRAEAFAAAEQNFDAAGSGVGLLARAGWAEGLGASGAARTYRFFQAAVYGRWSGERQAVTAAYLVTQARDRAGDVRRPGGFFVEAGFNVLRETTTFARYDDIATAPGTGASPTFPRVRTLALGLTQRVPNTGRLVVEYAEDRAGARRQRSVHLDLLLMF